MHRRLAWWCFFILILVVVFWFGIKASHHLLQYFRLTQKAEASSVAFQVKNVGTNQYRLEAHFSFLYEGHTYEGRDFVGHLYPNQWAAQRALKHFEAQTWTAWFNPKNLSNSVLEKKFPYKSVITFGILILLWIYYLFLSWFIYIRKR